MGAYQAHRSGENVWKGAMIGGIRALICANVIGAIVDGSMVGAIQAHNAGENPWAGAMFGAGVSGVASGTGSAIGGVIGSATGVAVIGAMSGSFVSGALSSAANAEAYGGNPWKAALYGGLYSVAYAATVRGAIALGQSMGGQGAENNGRGGGDPEALQKWLDENNPAPSGGSSETVKKAGFENLPPLPSSSQAFGQHGAIMPTVDIIAGGLEVAFGIALMVVAVAAAVVGPATAGISVGGAAAAGTGGIYLTSDGVARIADALKRFKIDQEFPKSRWGEN